MSNIEGLSKLVKIIQTETIVQQVYVNNEVKNVTTNVYALACPTCGRVIQCFQQGVSKQDCIKEIVNHKDELTKHFRYCSECGQKLNYEYGLPKEMK